MLPVKTSILQFNSIIADMQDFSPQLISYIVLAILAMIMMSLVWYDMTQYRIPNKFVFPGAMLGLFLNTILPDGLGFISTLPGALGFWKSLGGYGVALLILIPFYALRGMGAGDVKMMALVGAFLGPGAVVSITMLTFAFGGILSVFFSLKQKKLAALSKNLRVMLNYFKLKILYMRELPVASEMPDSVGKFPYALAIFTGTAAYFGLAQHTNLIYLF